MRRFALAALLAACATLAGAAPPRRAASAQPAARDWSRVASFTPTGAILIGNPAAKVKLVEYLSLTCPHCAAFAADGMPPLLARYVYPGTVSLEVRPILRNAADIVPTLLARCDGPSRWEPLSAAILAAQLDWLPKAENAPAPGPGASFAGMLRATAKASGLAALAARLGVPPTRIDACLASPVDADKLAAMTEEAFNGRQIPGTPSFLINGEFTGAWDWSGLERAIRIAL